jgi:hypothetical protein
MSVGKRYRPMENAIRKIVSSFGLGKVYTAIEQFAGTPRGMDFFEMFGFKSIGTKQDAWQVQRSNAYDYAENVLGRDMPSSDGYGDDYDYMRDTIYSLIKYGKHDKALKEIEEYYMYLVDEGLSDAEISTEMENLRKSLKNKFDVIPSNAIPQKYLEEYISTLSEDELDDLVLAYKYQEEITGPFYEWLFD